MARIVSDRVTRLDDGAGIAYLVTMREVAQHHLVDSIEIELAMTLHEIEVTGAVKDRDPAAFEHLVNEATRQGITVQVVR